MPDRDGPRKKYPGDDGTGCAVAWSSGDGWYVVMAEPGKLTGHAQQCAREALVRWRREIASGQRLVNEHGIPPGSVNRMRCSEESVGASGECAGQLADALCLALAALAEQWAVFVSVSTPQLMAESDDPRKEYPGRVRAELATRGMPGEVPHARSG